MHKYKSHTIDGSDAADGHDVTSEMISEYVLQPPNTLHFMFLYCLLFCLSDVLCLFCLIMSDFLHFFSFLSVQLPHSISLPADSTLDSFVRLQQKKLSFHRELQMKADLSHDLATES